MQETDLPTTVFEFDALRGVGQVALRVRKDQRVYALFGTNGVGKTKCLEALFQYHLLVCEPFMAHHRQLLNKSSFVAQSYNTETFSISVYESSSRVFHLSAQSADAEQHALPVVFLGASQRGTIQNKSSISVPIGTFEERRKTYFHSLVDSMDDGLSSLGMHTDVEQWFVTLAQSANPYQKQADNRKVEIDTLLQLLHQVDDRFDLAFLQIAGNNRVSLKVNGQITELRHLSSGFASLLKMLQAIISGYSNFTNEVQLANVKGIVLIDEIESHLHNSWQAKVVPLLKKLFPNTTFYIATHSPVVLSQLQEGEAYLLKRMDDGVVRSELIVAPNKRAFVDVLADAFGVDLNRLKRDALDKDDQSAAKQALLALLDDVKEQSS